MNEFVAKLHALRASHDQGATALEYGLLVALIAVAIIGAVTALGGGIGDTFDGVTEHLTGGAH